MLERLARALLRLILGVVGSLVAIGILIGMVMLVGLSFGLFFAALSIGPLAVVLYFASLGLLGVLWAYAEPAINAWLKSHNF